MFFPRGDNLQVTRVFVGSTDLFDDGPELDNERRVQQDIHTIILGKRGGNDTSSKAPQPVKYHRLVALDVALFLHEAFSTYTSWGGLQAL